MTIRKYRILSGAIDSSGDASVTTAHAIYGKVIAVGVNYPAATCEVDLDTVGDATAQKIVNLAAANTDVVIYPRVALEDVTGTALDPSDAQGGDTALYGEFAVAGPITLTIASGTEGQSVIVDILVEE